MVMCLCFGNLIFNLDDSHALLPMRLTIDRVNLEGLSWNQSNDLESSIELNFNLRSCTAKASKEFL